MFHILGYGFAPDALALAGFFHRMKIRRDDRTKCLLAFMRGKGIDLNASEVMELSKGDAVSCPHFAQVMVQQGYVANN